MRAERNLRKTKTRESAGRASPRLTRDLLEFAPDAWAVLRPDGRIQVANERFCALFGYRPAELAAVPMRSLIPAELAYLTDPRLRAEPGLAEAGRHKSGAPVPIELRARALGAGSRSRVLISVRGIAARPAAGPADVALDSELVASLSHDLRTPLNAIIGFAELLHRGKVGPLAPEHREYVGDILASGRKLQNLINEVLSLARLETGRSEHQVETIDLRHLADEVQTMLRGLATERRTRLEVVTDPELGLVSCDPARLKHALTKAAAAAMRVAPPPSPERRDEDGRITLRIAASGKGRFRIVVEDGRAGRPGRVKTQIEIEAAPGGDAGQERSIGG